MFISRFSFTIVGHINSSCYLVT